MLQQRPLAGNVPLFYIYQFFNSFILDRGIWILFLASRGFTLSEIGLIEALYHAVVFLFEVPTGYIADKYGKKGSLLLSQVLGCIAAGCMSLASYPAMIVVCFLVGGLVGSLQSGATSALVYETLKAEGKHSGFAKLTSHLSAVMLISMAISGSAGGFLSDISWGSLYAAKTIIHAASFIILLFIKEPRYTGLVWPQSDSSRWKGAAAPSFVGQLREGYNFIRTSRPFLTLSLYGALLYSMSWSISFYSQLLFQNNGLSNTAIGTVNGAETWIAAAVAAVAYIGERRIGKPASLILSGIGFALCLIALSAGTGSITIICCFFLLSVFISFLEPLLETYLNELVPSSMRATMLSVFNMMVSAGMMITFLLLGVLADRTNLTDALKMVLVFWVPMLAVLLLWCLRFNWLKKETVDCEAAS